MSRPIKAEGSEERNSYADDENVRLQRFNEALSKFLELLDDRATIGNFQTALPHLSEKVLDGSRREFVNHLKESIVIEKDRLVDSYSLGQRLMDLEHLTREADCRNEEARQKGTTASELHFDAWRPKVDISTAVHAPLVLQSRQRVAQLEAELEGLERDNERENDRLVECMDQERRLRERARDTLNQLEETLASLESAPEEEITLRQTLDTLLNELGPRGIA